MKLGFIGAGNMASALARGIGEPVLVADVDAGKARALATELGGEAVATNAELAERADAVVLCHKPAQLAEVAAEVGDRARVVISILAATGTDRLAEAYPGVPVYRFIPNIPAEVRRGVLCYVPGARAADGPEDEILELFGRAGSVIALADEPLIEPAMAAHELRARVHGARGRVARRRGRGARADPEPTPCAWSSRRWRAPPPTSRAHGYDTAALRRRVATPGGITEQGLIRLEERGLRERLPRGRGRGGGGDEAMRLWLAITRGDVADYVRDAGARLPRPDLHPRSS